MKRVRHKKRIPGGRSAAESRERREKRSRARDDAAEEKASLQRKEGLFEVEVLDGWGPICREEIGHLVSTQGALLPVRSPGAIPFEYAGSRANVLNLRTAVAVFELLYFKVPHPLSIVQEAHLERLIGAIAAIRAVSRFSSFRIGAAGSDSDVFRKIKKTIAAHSGLVNDEENGQMSIRFRRSQLKPFGWDVLIRLTPLPLSARAWRVENMPGALNATIAAGMILLMDPKPGERFLNVMCGSGTLIAERAVICPAKALIGVDVSGEALEKARRNLSHVKPLSLLQQDAKRLSLGDASVDVVCADLPWGRLIGDKRDLERCYTDSLSEMTRVCSPDGKLAIITQENALFEKALQTHKGYWSLICSVRVKQSEYKPKVYILHRTRKPFRDTSAAE
jgi:tRNA (guanine6-N2)-methyltransferase